MAAKPSLYIPQVFRSFKGFVVKDLKEWRSEKRLEIILDKEPDKQQICSRCSTKLGAYNDQYSVRAKHLRMMGWTVEIVFWREKRHCPRCKKTRSEKIDFISEGSPHITEELAWWITRLSEITSVFSISKLERIDKMTCYRVDKYILRRLLQGYKIPKVKKIAVDEVYAMSPKQQKEDETRDDLFLTVIVDLKTHKVIWVSQSRRKEALDEFFKIIGSEACKEIEAVATDQHEGYSASVREHCPQAIIVWDRFHLVQKFNEALNEDRRDELARIDPEGNMGDLMNGKYRYIFLTKAQNRNKIDQWHINEVMRLNQKMTKLELIKEHFHKLFESVSSQEAKIMMSEIYQWAWDAGAKNIWKWVNSIREEQRFWNYFDYRITTGLSEGINRVIKGIKWQAYGYKDMHYFALKILQKAGYLNHRFICFSHK